MIKLNKIFAFILATVIFTSCSSTHPGPTLQAQGNTSEKDIADFVELTNGEIIEGKITNDQLAYGKGFIVINRTKYPNREVRSYQRKYKYYRKDSTNDFHTRIIKGDINLYRSILEHYQHVYFIQKGIDGDLIAYNESELRKMIQDHQPAIDEFNKYQALSAKQKNSIGNGYLNNVIAIYNRKYNVERD